jgi:hypothetical protein
VKASASYADRATQHNAQVSGAAASCNQLHEQHCQAILTVKVPAVLPATAEVLSEAGFGIIPWEVGAHGLDHTLISGFSSSESYPLPAPDFVVQFHRLII